VGKFTIKASLDRTTSEAAEPIILIVRISGTGNIKLIEKPEIPSIPGTKILDPEIKEDINIVGNYIKGYKEFRYPIIPQIDGEHIIPQTRIAYFDPDNKKYHLIETEKLRFTATQTATATAKVEASGFKVLGTDINYIKSDITKLKSQNFSARWWLILLYCGSLIVIGISVFYRRHQARLLTDRAYARKLRSSRLVRRRLKQAANYLRKNKEKEFYALLSKVILGYVGDRYNLDVGALTKEQLINELNKKKIKQGIINEVIDLLNQCDTVRFSQAIEFKEPATLLEKTKEILGEL